MLYVILNLPKPGGGTKPKWISTGLKDVRGNKKKADEILPMITSIEQYDNTHLVILCNPNNEIE
jgi:hypothetical protein